MITIMITIVTMIMKNMNNYLKNLNKEVESAIVQEIKKQAEILKTPIIANEGINLLIQLIRIGNYGKVLEIGSAIGYSAIMMALNTCCEVTTIEKNEDSYNLAKENIARANLIGRIDLILGDALEVELNGLFDLIFIDAAKAQYLKFFDRFKNNLKSGGIIVCDNLLLHGMVENQDSVEQKRIKSLVRKIDDFNHALIDFDDFDTYIYEIGDGMSISIKK